MGSYGILVDKLDKDKEIGDVNVVVTVVGM